MIPRVSDKQDIFVAEYVHVQVYEGTQWMNEWYNQKTQWVSSSVALLLNKPPQHTIINHIWKVELILLLGVIFE